MVEYIFLAFFWLVLWLICSLFLVDMLEFCKEEFKSIPFWLEITIIVLGPISYCVIIPFIIFTLLYYILSDEVSGIKAKIKNIKDSKK